MNSVSCLNSIATTVAIMNLPEHLSFDFGDKSAHFASDNWASSSEGSQGDSFRQSFDQILTKNYSSLLKTANREATATFCERG